jgi:hypothetical protein
MREDEDEINDSEELTNEAIKETNLSQTGEASADTQEEE